MITRKVVYVTEDGSEFDSVELAEEHVRDEKVKENLTTFILDKDLPMLQVDIITDFITENSKELYCILSPMFEEI